MPNPLADLSRVVRRSSKTDTDRPVPVPPVPERYAGTNFAWRGTEQHGVETNQGTMNPDGVGFDAENPDPRAIPVLVDVHDDKDTPDPIPVRIVTEYKREIRRFSTDRRFCTYNDIDEVVGRDENRTRITITNIDPIKSMYYGYSRETITQFGCLLTAGKEITLSTEEPVYVVAAGTSSPGDDCQYQLVVEFVRGE